MKKLYKFLASIKLAVVLLVALAIVLGVATFYESLYDAKTAQHLVYSSPWFVVFLVVLFINVFCAAAIRYPWKAYQTGFVITHLGILVILAGSLQTMVSGIDGNMPIVEGGSNDRVTLDKPVLVLGAGGESLKEIDAEFRWNPPRPEHPYRYPLGNGVTAVIDGYYHHAVAETRYVATPAVPDAPGHAGGMPALRINFTSSRFNMDQWLTPLMGPTQMGLAKVSFQTTSQAVMDELLKTKGKPAKPTPGALGLLVGDRALQIPAPAAGTTQPLGDTPYKIHLVTYAPDGEVRDQKLVSKSDKPNNPAVEVEFSGAKGSLTLILFANDPKQNSRVRQEGEQLPIRALFNFDPSQAEDAKTKQLTFYLTPDNKLYYRLSDGRCAEMPIDKALATGWMDICVTAKEFLPSARPESGFTEYKPAKGEKDTQGPPPAIRITLEGAQEPGPFWLQQGGDLQMGRNQEGKPFRVGYGYRSVSVGVKIELIKFIIDHDPGTRNPAAYKSRVRVNGEEHLIQMNEPLHMNNFTFYQASYSENGNGPSTSYLSVAYDPGIFLKYTGSILLVGGIFTMFYLKPYMIGRKKHFKSQGESAGAESPEGDETE